MSVGGATTVKKLPKKVESLQQKLFEGKIELEEFFQYVNSIYKEDRAKQIFQTVIHNIKIGKENNLLSSTAKLFLDFKLKYEDFFSEKLEDDKYLKSTDTFYDDGFIEAEETVIAFDLSLQEVSRPSSPELALRKNKRRKPQDGPVLLWFRRDLRLEDNPALNKAASLNKPVIPVFVWSETEECPLTVGGARKVWLGQSLASLHQDLQDKYGAMLVLRTSENLAVTLVDLVRETSATDIVWATLYEPLLRERDQGIQTKLEAEGVRVHTEHGYLLHRPDQVSVAGVGVQGIGNVTHFMECCKVNPGNGIKTLVEPPKWLVPPSTWPTSCSLQDLNLYVQPLKDKNRVDWAAEIRGSWDFREAGGQEAMRRFFNQNVDHYDAESSRADQAWTSELSPYLHWGQVSPQALMQEAVRANIAPKFRRKLAWRDLSYWLFTLFPSMPTTSLRRAYRSQWWSSDSSLLRAWQKGMTGYPLVDAAMRQLLRTGWTNNYMRHLVACFLVSYLRINWVEGLKWFADTLVDFDLAISSMMWQNAGMSGLDQWNFVLHPVHSAVTCDPEGEFVRRWVPELAELPTYWIHQPWEADRLDLRYDVVLGQTYPARVLEDLDKARAASLQDVTEIRRNSGQDLIDPLNGRDLMELPLGLMPDSDQQAVPSQVPLITRNEIIWATMQPPGPITSNPFDCAVVRPADSRRLRGAELPAQHLPSLPDHLVCSLCKQICRRAVRLSCCSTQACRGCGTKYVTRQRECWNCGKGNITTKQLTNDQELRKAVNEFRVLPPEPTTPDHKQFAGPCLQLCRSFSDLAKETLPRSKSTGNLEESTSPPAAPWGTSYRLTTRSRTILARDRSSESDSSKESEEDENNTKRKETKKFRLQPARIRSKRYSRSHSLSRVEHGSESDSVSSVSESDSKEESLYESPPQPKSRRESEENRERDVQEVPAGKGRQNLSSSSGSDGLEKIKFSEVSCFLFSRMQGWVSVPREGGHTLGMSGQHVVHHKWNIGDQVTEEDAGQTQTVPELCIDQEDEEISFNAKYTNHTSEGTVHESREEISSWLDDISKQIETPVKTKLKDSGEPSRFVGLTKSVDEIDLAYQQISASGGDATPVKIPNVPAIRATYATPSRAALKGLATPPQGKFSVSPVSSGGLQKKSTRNGGSGKHVKGVVGTRGLTPLRNRERVSLLRNNGVVSLDKREAEEIRLIRDSREQCGCSCVDSCQPETCECALNEIECQVEKSGFPCSCLSNKHCHNPAGRRIFDQAEVQLHFIQTMLSAQL